MKTINVKNIALGLLLLLGMGVFAQDSVLTKKVTVFKEFNPMVDDASKIETAPELVEPKVYKPSFEYSFFNAPMKTEYNIQFINADEYAPKQPEEAGEQSYLQGGVGNYSTVYAEMFYNAYRSEKQNVNLFYSHKSSFGKVKLQDGTKVEAPHISNYGMVDFQRRYRESVLNSSLHFSRLGYEYYGYENLPTNQAAFYWDDATTILAEDGKQLLTNVGFDLSLSSLQRRGADVKYDLDFAFNTTSNDDDFSENQFDVSGLFEKELDAVKIGINAEVNVGFYAGQDTSTVIPFYGETFTGLKAVPYFSIDRKNWDLTLGAGIDYYQMDSVRAQVFVPELDFDFAIVPKYFMGHINVTGGAKKNTFAQVMKENRFVVNDIERKPTKTLLDVRGGITGLPTRELSLKLDVGYKIIEDQLFYVNEFASDGSSLTDTYYTNRFHAEYGDLDVLSFHGEMNYDTHKDWSATLAFDYFSYGLDNTAAAWNMPEYLIHAFGHYDLDEKIKLKARFMFIPERAVKISVSDAVDYLPVTYDFSLSGEYKFRDNIYFFLDINNAIASKYYLYNGYPGHRFNLLAGARYTF